MDRKHLQTAYQREAVENYSRIGIQGAAGRDAPLGAAGYGIIGIISMKHSDQSNHSFGAHAIYKLVSLFAFLIDTIRSGVSPTQFDSKAWYDRTIRVGDGLILFLVFATGLILLIAERFKH